MDERPPYSPEGKNQCSRCIAQKLCSRGIWCARVLNLVNCIQEFVESEGVELEEGTKDDPPLGKFEEQISKYKGIEKEIQALPTSANIGWIKVRIKIQFLKCVFPVTVSQRGVLFSLYILMNLL